MKLHFILITSALLSFNVFAQNCAESFKTLLNSYNQIQQNQNPNTFIDSRKFLKEFLKSNNIPSFVKKDARGIDIPYILVNKETSPKLSTLFENSYGSQIVLQHNYNNDHGLMRIGSNIIDVDAPGARGFGEIHNTGLAWKDVDTYVRRRNPGSYNIVEVSYLLSPGEYRDIEYYQRIRRSSIFRVKFTFGGRQASPHPFMLENGEEHCFIFCKAGSVNSHISELKSKLSNLGLANPDEFLSIPKVKLGLKEFEDKVVSSDSNNLSPDLITTTNLVNLISSELPNSLRTDEDKNTFIRWLISYDVSKRYSKVLNELGVTSDFGVGDSKNTRATAVLVYDPTVSEDVFKSANYETNGKSFRWPNTAQNRLD